MRVAVLGVGLIGGSIGLAARRRAGAEVSGYDPDPEVRARALELGALDTACETLQEAVADAQVVFVAAPVGALAGTVAQALDAALAGVAGDERFVGGHPLAGAETAGVEHAREDLFEGATWYLTPTRESTAGVLYERLYGLLRRFGARPTAIDADSHDRLMACISHLPHVLANLLAAQAAALRGDGEDASERLPAVGPSFRDAIRVAGANSDIWTDIYKANADALLGALDELSGRLAQARALIEQGDAGALRSWNEAARRDRDALLAAGLGEVAPMELRVHVPNRPGVVAEIALALGGEGVNILDMVLSPSPDNSRGVIALWTAGGEQAQRAERLIGGLGFPVTRA
jgi:prephenate dehydrogenase